MHPRIRVRRPSGDGPPRPLSRFYGLGLDTQIPSTLREDTRWHRDLVENVMRRLLFPLVSAESERLTILQ